MLLYIYALVDTPPSRELKGLAGEPLRAVGWGIQDQRDTPLFALIGEMKRAPRLEEATLRAHDTAIRRAMAVTEAVLPARFGTCAPDERTLARALRPRLAELARAVALVSGREQMSLRLFQRAGAGSRPQPPSRARSVQWLAEDAARPGTRHLTTRAREQRRAAEAPEFETLRPAIAPFVRAEVIERHAAPPLLASIYHLIDRGKAEAYSGALARQRLQVEARRLGRLEERAARRSGAVRVSISGPWPPYAFAPPLAGL